MSKTLTWKWFMINRDLDRQINGDGRVLYSASIALDGRGYSSREFEFLPDADDELVKMIAKDGYTVEGYTPTEQLGV